MSTDPNSALNVILFVAVPYIAITVFVVGHYWRYRYDKFGWTTRSSQLYERRLLRLGSPMFHFGILLVALGHIGGLLVPESWTNAVGISETAYHVVAVGLGTVAGFCTLGGAAIRYATPKAAVSIHAGVRSVSAPLAGGSCACARPLGSASPEGMTGMLTRASLPESPRRCRSRRRGRARASGRHRAARPARRREVPVRTRGRSGRADTGPASPTRPSPGP